MSKGFRRHSGIYCSMVLIFALLFCCSSVGYANYELDPDFGIGGKTRTGFMPGNDDRGYSVAIDSLARIVVAGESSNGINTDFALTRYNTDGTLDMSFNSNGRVTTDFGLIDRSQSLVIDSLGRIVVAGKSKIGTNYDFALARYNTDGTLDTSFNTTGMVTTDFGTGGDYANSLAIDNLGRIVVAGESDNVTDFDFALARYKTDGTLDTLFGTNGMVTTDFGLLKDTAFSLAIDSSGRIVVAGKSQSGIDFDFALARYKTDGTLDTSFGTTGMVTTDFGSGDDTVFSLAIDSLGRIVVAGESENGTDNDFALARYTSNGTLDTSFGTNGIVTTDFGSGDQTVFSLAIDSLGRLVLAGESFTGTDFDFALARYTSDGTLDTSFGTNGIMTTDFGSGSDSGFSVAIDRLDRLVVAGYSYNGTDYDFALVRYKEEVAAGTSSGGGCNFSSLPALGFLLAIPLLFLYKRGK